MKPLSALALLLALPTSIATHTPVFDHSHLCHESNSEPTATDLDVSTVVLSDFCMFLTKFKRSYPSYDHLFQRIKIFEKNRVFVSVLNFLDSDAHYSVIDSPFADLSGIEFKQQHLMNFIEDRDHSSDPHDAYLTQLSEHFGFTRSQLILQAEKHQRRIKGVQLTDDAPVDRFDWQEQGKVTSVKNQGSIGTCWAFSAVGAIESQVAIKRNQLINLSVEQLVECSNTFNASTGEADCSEFGGWPYLAYEYIESFGGIFTEDEFPYCSGTVDEITRMPLCQPCMPKAYDVISCGDHSDMFCDVSTTLGQKPGGLCTKKDKKASLRSSMTKVTTWKKLSSDEDQLRDDLKENGPVSVALNALFLQFYRSGVVSLPLCTAQLNHAVLLVGYGQQKKTFWKVWERDEMVDYWRVKNSWGEGFGEEGYFKIKRGVGQCGINLVPSIAFVQ